MRLPQDHELAYVHVPGQHQLPANLFVHQSQEAERQRRTGGTESGSIQNVTTLKRNTFLDETAPAERQPAQFLSLSSQKQNYTTKKLRGGLRSPCFTLAEPTFSS